MTKRRTQLLLACASWIALAAHRAPPRSLEVVRFQPGLAARGASWVGCVEGAYWSPWRARPAQGYCSAAGLPAEPVGEPGRVQDYVDLGR